MLLQVTLSRQCVLLKRSNNSRIGVRMTRKAFQRKARSIHSIELLFKVCTTNGFGARSRQTYQQQKSQRISALSLRHRSHTTASFLIAPHLSRFLRPALLTDLSCHVAAKQAARLEAVAERLSWGQAIMRVCSHIFSPQQALCWQTEGVAA